MVENVSPLTPGQRPTKPQKPLPTEGERSFKDILQDSLDSVNKMQAEATVGSCDKSRPFWSNF